MSAQQDGASDIATLLAEAAKISGRAAELAAQNQVDAALELEREAEELRERARKVVSSRPEPGNVTNEVPTETGQSARAVTIAALGEIGVPASPHAIAEYAWARFDVKLDHRALASLRRDELRAWSSPRSFRAVYLVPALEGHRFLAVRGKLARSDWSLDRRLIGPWSERADHLVATLHLARQLAWLSSAEPHAADRLRDLLRVYAATVVGAQHPADRVVDPKHVEHAAQAELNVIGDQDAKWRVEAAERAAGLLNEEQALWGATPPRLVHRNA
jgi:hypothetical protein